MGDLSPLLAGLLSSQLILALLISLAVIPLLRRFAPKIGLIDHPGGRKQHISPVPLVGGAAIVFAGSITLIVLGMPIGYEGLILATFGLFLVGFVDDKYDISAKFRLVAQASLVASALFWDNVWLNHIILTDSYTMNLGLVMYPFTILLIMGLINAINMLDGLDGLSSGIVLIILGTLIGISSTAGETNISIIAGCVFGSVLGFWAYNYRFAWRQKASVFMGDSGTTVLGFILPYLAIKLSITAPTHAPKSMLLWLFAIPIWDICAVIIKRIRDGKSPLQAGRDHIHHVLMNSGLTVRHSLHLIYLLTMTTVAFGVAIQYFKFSQIEAFATFFVFMAIYLGRVGSLTRKTATDSYDFNTLGERRESVYEDEKVIELVKRSRTLS